MSVIEVAGRKVGPGQPVVVVAELSGNAGKDHARAVEMVYAAKEAGADWIKAQAFTPEAMTLDSDAPPFRLTWRGRERTLYDLYSETAMPLDWHGRLKALCDSLGLVYFASVFDKGGVDLMVSLGVPLLKVASFELTDLALIRACAETGLPLILSTGMAGQVDIIAAVFAAEMGGAGSPILLRCTSAYPAPVQAANLQTLASWRKSYRRSVVGLSDHSQSNVLVSAAVALGACLVERHFKLDDSDSGPDSQFSDTPAQFAEMVRTIRDTEAALGTVHYGPTESELPMLKLRRSLWVIRDIAPGERLTPENVRVLRPSDGLPPSEYDRVLGRRARVAIVRATPLAWEMIE